MNSKDVVNSLCDYAKKFVKEYKKEKNEIMAMKVSQLGLKPGESPEEQKTTTEEETSNEDMENAGNIRFPKLVQIDEDFKIGNLCIKPFSIPHDAANPCGFSIYNNRKKLTIATDIGHMNDYVLENLK